MHSLHPELTGAMVSMLEKLDQLLRQSDYRGAPVKMYLAGGMAVHFYCGTRYTADVDATFSTRILLPLNELTIEYLRADGMRSALYFDANYNDTFAVMHPDYRERAVEWEGVGNPARLVALHVLSPLDLAVSKISRFSSQDHDDILALASRRLFLSAEFRRHAHEALDYYVGNTQWIRTTIEQVCSEIA